MQKNSLEAINQQLIEYFDDNLVSIIVFGSSCRRDSFNLTSDIDYTIILNTLPVAQDAISRDIKRKLLFAFPLVAFNIYAKNEFTKIIKNNDWLALTLDLGYKSYYDDKDFFKNTVAHKVGEVKKKLIGNIEWYHETHEFDKTVTDHFLGLSEDYLASAKSVYSDKNYNIALELLLSAVHCFMLAQLTKIKIFTTKGEIVQFFFNFYQRRDIMSLRDTFLQLEQNVGQKYTFDFDSDGHMQFPATNVQKSKKLFDDSETSLTTLVKNFSDK